MRTRRIVFNIHLYIGLAVGLFLILSGLTGSMIVFREEIEKLMHPELLETAVRGERVPLQIVVNGVKRAYPEEDSFYPDATHTAGNLFVQDE